MLNYHYLLKLILLLFLTACQQSPTSSSLTNLRPQPLNQDPNLEVYFNQNQSQGADYSDPYRNLERPGDNLERIMIEAINNAQSSIDLAVQEFRLPQLAQALVKQHQAGVKVRVILENNYNRPWSELTTKEVAQLQEREANNYRDYFALIDENKDNQLSAEEVKKNDALIILKNANIPIIDDTEDGSKGSGLMHHKFIIIDQSIMLITSANFTLSDVHGDFLNPESRGNNNHLLKIKSSQLAQIFTKEFNLMWGDGQGGAKNSKFGLKKPVRLPQNITLGASKITVNFSPISPTKSWSDSSNGLIGKTLEQATESVDLALFVFSEQKLADIIEERYQNGVKVRVLIDKDFAFQNYSEGLDMLGVALSRQCRYETNNNPWSSPITTVGIPQLPRGDKLHHKFGIVDQKIIITGSHNWSEAANHKNDETLVIIESPIVAAHFQQEFERLYKNASLGISKSLREKIKHEKKNCSN